MPSIPVPPKATAEGLQAASTGGGQTAAVNPQQQQPTQPVWGGLLSKMYPTQPRTMNFTPGSTKTTPLGAAQFGQAFGIMKSKSAAVTKRPWTINGADALTSVQYYSRKRKDGSQGRASLTMPASTDKGRGAATQKTAELSPFAQGFVRRCAEAGLTGDMTKQAAARVVATMPVLKSDLELVTKVANPLTLLTQGARAVGNLAPKITNVASRALTKAPAINIPGAANPSLWSKIKSIGGGALQGASVGGLPDTAYGVLTGQEEPSWGTMLGAGVGALTGSRRFRAGFGKLLPGVASRMNNPASGTRKVMDTAVRWGMPISAGHSIGRMAMTNGLEQAAQQSGFGNFAEMQELAKQYNSGDVIGLAKGLWSKMSPEHKMALLGAGAMAGGGLLSAATGSAAPAQYGALGGAGLMAPAAMKHLFGGTPWSGVQRQPAQPPGSSYGSQNPLARAGIAPRNEYQYQQQAQ